MKNIRVKYSSPAAPRFNIQLNKLYTVEELQEKYNLKLDYIKITFTPIDNSWGELDKTNKRKQYKKEILDTNIAEDE